MRLSEKLRPEEVLISPEVSTRDELFRLFARLFADAGLVASADEVVERLLEREAILSTGIGGGMAVPHAQLRGLQRLVVAASVHPDGIAYPALDERPVQLVFCLIAGTDTTAEHLAGLARLARLARSSETVEELVRARSGEDFLRVLVDVEAR